ncbi:7118_t:CDS:2 [Funneliformis mosseae]|uniref:Ribosome assembly protein 3 n=1 Tax=Funneliformis mosseae TaxID=27381 RepID=A0A9N9D4S6_FUNMO|nr:7118_t:CDS:2 [Funneliformis mosseae]
MEEVIKDSIKCFPKKRQQNGKEETNQSQDDNEQRSHGDPVPTHLLARTQAENQFRDYYMNRITKAFGEDLDKLRKKEVDLDSNKLEILINTLESGIIIQSRGFMKGYIDPYFYTTPSEQWSLNTFITTYNGQSLKEMAEKLIETYRADKKECAYLIDIPEGKSAKTAILRNRFELLIESAKSANATLNATFTEADASVSGYQTSDQQVMRSTNYETNPFNIEFSQKRKCAFDTEEEEESEEEYNADKTIIGGRNTTWVVDGINIRQRLTKYQEEKNLTKSKPEYYDVIFFNNKDQDGFLGTLPESTIIKMNKEIMEEIKGAEEDDIRSLLLIAISTKRKKILNNKENIMTLLKKSSRYILLITWDIHYNGLAPILNKIFINNKKDWHVKYGETCLRASADDQNSQKGGGHRRSPIDTIVIVKEENEGIFGHRDQWTPSSERLITFHGGSNENNQDAEDAHE